MHEFHGWFVLAETPLESDVGGLYAAVDEIRARIAALRWGSGSARLEVHNGSWTLTLTGLANRIRHEAADVDELLELVGTRLPGSYGVLYERADEMTDPPGPQAFRVRIMARGAVREHADPFLSPVIPVIEDDEAVEKEPGAGRTG